MLRCLRSSENNLQIAVRTGRAAVMHASRELRHGQMTHEIVVLKLGFLAASCRPTLTTWAQATFHTATLIHGHITGLGETLVKNLQHAPTISFAFKQNVMTPGRCMSCDVPQIATTQASSKANDNVGRTPVEAESNCRLHHSILMKRAN